MHELKRRAAEYIRMEEMQTLHTKFCNDYTPSAATPPKPPSRPNHRPRESRQPRFTRYAPLNVSRSRLLDEALQADLILPPRTTSNPPNVDMTKYCHYHHNNGHTTDVCKALQDKIEELVRADHFRCFIQKDDHPPRSDHRHPPRDSRHDKRPNKLTTRDPQPARTDVAPTDPHYATLLTSSLAATLVEDPPPQLE